MNSRAGGSRRARGTGAGRGPAAAPVLLLLDSAERVPIPLCTDCAAAPGDLSALWAAVIAAGLCNREQRLAAARVTDASELDEARARVTGQAMATALRARRPVALVPAAGGRRP